MVRLGNTSIPVFRYEDAIHKHIVPVSDFKFFTGHE